MTRSVGAVIMKSAKPNVPCGRCTLCCEWQGDQSIAPELEKNEIQKFDHVKIQKFAYDSIITKIVLKMGSDGNCTYLTKDGCSIHNIRPKFCQEYDCREILKEVLNQDNNYFARIMIQAIKISEK